MDTFTYIFSNSLKNVNEKIYILIQFHNCYARARAYSQILSLSLSTYFTFTFTFP